MATKTRQTRNKRSSALEWAGGATGALAAAAVAGAAVGFAANLGRKFVVQGMSASGDWAETLAAEHAIVLAIFDKIEATEDNQAVSRKHLLTKLKNALGKHAIEEENAVYPALRDANSAHDADALNAEHGYVKTYLYELENMPAEGSAWLTKVRELRTMLEAHMKMEEDEVFPALKAALSDEQNAKLATAVQREGLKLA